MVPPGSEHGAFISILTSTPPLDAEACRFSHAHVAQRVLPATGERASLLTDGAEIRIFISDRARIDSHFAISLTPHWKRLRDVLDSIRLLLALASHAGIQALKEIIAQSRLQQARVSKYLREQACNAIRDFIQELLDQHPDKATVARQLWHAGLFDVYRLLLILKHESADDHARSFAFASTALWRGTRSPTIALAPKQRRSAFHRAFNRLNIRNSTRWQGSQDADRRIYVCGIFYR